METYLSPLEGILLVGLDVIFSPEIRASMPSLCTEPSSSWLWCILVRLPLSDHFSMLCLRCGPHFSSVIAVPYLFMPVNGSPLHEVVKHKVEMLSLIMVTIIFSS